MERHYEGRGGPGNRHLTHERVHIAFPIPGLKALLKGMDDAERFKRAFREALWHHGVIFEGGEPMKPWSGAVTDTEVVFLGWRVKQ